MRATNDVCEKGRDDWKTSMIVRILMKRTGYKTKWSAPDGTDVDDVIGNGPDTLHRGHRLGIVFTGV